MNPNFSIVSIEHLEIALAHNYIIWVTFPKLVNDCFLDPNTNQVVNITKVSNDAIYPYVVRKSDVQKYKLVPLSTNNVLLKNIDATKYPYKEAYETLYYTPFDKCGDVLSLRVGTKASIDYDSIKEENEDIVSELKKQEKCEYASKPKKHTQLKEKTYHIFTLEEAKEIIANEYDLDPSEVKIEFSI